MKHVRKSALYLPLVLVVLLPGVIAFHTSETNVSAQTMDTPGTLMAIDAQGKPKSACPLTHTDVKADISGFISRVVVTQQFHNPFSEKIEAVYTFPLPNNAAVDDMTMIIGERRIRGKILPREEALAVYEGAKSRGQTASLLDQERPNIFTQ
ncbi:MAG TPA: VIT domain-containing protein, partial [Pyrinomonadaceae bacterium]|nr:VIT domain-containing protein [Pyrinomonadaceae bacterium]